MRDKNARNDREFKGMGKEDCQQTHIPGDRIFLETLFSYSHKVSFFFPLIHTEKYMWCTHNNLIQPSHVNKYMQLISYITMLPKNT